MKHFKIALVASIIAVSAPAFAGNPLPPEEEPFVIPPEDTAGTSGGIVVPLLIIALIGLAAS